jgi:ATP-binding cassette subfamily E protein 1
VANLSGGELQRLAIVVCLGTPAMVYLIDEPSAGLDCEQRVLVAKVIRRWVRDHLQRTCFVIEHDAVMMCALADKMILFSGNPGIEAYASTPMPVAEGFNAFLKDLNVTFRRDPTNHRPRINKPESVKDREQKASGNYYYFPDRDEKDDKDDD